MSYSVARRVATAGAVILVATLVMVGVGTAAVMHTQRVDALDESILTAAHGRAHPDVAADLKIEVEHSRSPVDAWLVSPDNRRVPDEPAQRALETERPVFVDLGDERLVLLPFEIYDRRGEHYRLAAAAAPRVTLARSVGQFALVYSLLAAIAAVVATIVQAQVVRRAFRPLDRARKEADEVVGLGEGKRLTEAGPVEIRSLLEGMNALLDRLESAYRAQSRFTAEAAHELRTPVTAMLGELDVTLRGERSEEEYRQALGSVREEVQRLGRLVEGLTAMARIDAGQVDRGRELVRAAEVADSALAAESGGLAEAGCEVRVEIDDDPELVVHRPLLEMAVGNLLRNAARHAPGSEVVLRVGREGGQAVFTVDDSGPGVPEEQREELFARFTRSGQARQRDRAGLGLGLPIAREVARRHGGDCTLHNSPIGGLRARLAVSL